MTTSGLSQDAPQQDGQPEVMSRRSSGRTASTTAAASKEPPMTPRSRAARTRAAAAVAGGAPADLEPIPETHAAAFASAASGESGVFSNGTLCCCWLAWAFSSGVVEGRAYQTARPTVAALHLMSIPSNFCCDPLSPNAGDDTGSQQPPRGARRTRSAAAAAHDASDSEAGGAAQTPRSSARATRQRAHALPSDSEPAAASDHQPPAPATRRRASQQGDATESSGAAAPAAPAPAASARKPAAPARSGRAAAAAAPASNLWNQEGSDEDLDGSDDGEFDFDGPGLLDALAASIRSALAVRTPGSSTHHQQQQKPKQQQPEPAVAATAASVGKQLPRWRPETGLPIPAGAATAADLSAARGPARAAAAAAAAAAAVAPPTPRAAAAAAAPAKEPGLAKRLAAPPRDAVRAAKEEKARAPDTAGAKWYGLPAPEVTEDVKRDLRLLRLRGAYDPKRFYKSFDETKFPKYFQVGFFLQGAGRPRMLRAYAHAHCLSIHQPPISPSSPHLSPVWHRRQRPPRRPRGPPLKGRAQGDDDSAAACRRGAVQEPQAALRQAARGRGAAGARGQEA
jgi:hypothetical protein